VIRLYSRWLHRTYRVDNFDAPGYGKAGEDRSERPIEESNVVSSEICGRDARGLAGQHTLMLDLDVPAVLIPSSTPGHSHLYVDFAIPWDRYEKLLRALADCGIVEPGYVFASIERKHTALRLPWVRKGDPVSSSSEPTEEPPF
jgi:hypothetical protein